jgi:hypothetical protein
MAITNAQQAKQMQLVKKRKDGKRPGYYGADAGFGDDDYKDAASNFQDSFNEKTSGGGTFITDQDAQRVFDARPDLKEAFDNADAEAEKRRKAKEKADKERRAKERKEARKEKTKLTKAEKKKKRMQLAAFKRFQKLEDYVDPFGDETTFADMTGEEAAKKAGYNVNEFGPPGSITFDYDKSRFRDPKTGKIKDEFTEMVDINKGKKDIFGRPKKSKFVEQIKSDAIPGYDFSINPVQSNFKSGLGTLTSTGNTTKVTPNDFGLQMYKPPGILGFLTDTVRPPTGLQAFNTLEEARNIQDLTTRFAGGDESAYDEFEDYINRNKPPVTGGGDSDNQTDPCKGPNPPAYCFVNQNPTDPVVPTQILSSRIIGSQFDPTFFAAEGGMAEENNPVGGIMDLESGRQMYFLGKLVKKAGRALKKITKSPLGKAAILGGLAYFGGGGGLPKFLSGKGLGGFSTKTLFSKANPLLFTDDKLSMGKLALTSAALPFLFPEEENNKFDIDAYYAANKGNPNAILNRRIAGSEFISLAEGGSTEKEPVATKTMPLLDMDGQEMDLRAEGGFVPIGRMEKADDVPARLSKNEFVFTAEAVRNAGEGDVDKGAEVMYNMMKNLESGGEVSEESQGLDGAREMFQTSQRLGEVI